jgi:hypothetical protein
VYIEMLITTEQEGGGIKWFPNICYTVWEPVC